MKLVTTREIQQKTKAVFEMAETERVAVKRGNKYVTLVVTDNPDKVFVDEDWIREFMSIPAQYRCNPFEFSPSGDLFYADRRNVEQLKKTIEIAKKQREEGKVTRIKTKEGLSSFLDSL
jgi:hypothetical protein